MKAWSGRRASGFLLFLPRTGIEAVTAAVRAARSSRGVAACRACGARGCLEATILAGNRL